MGSMTGAPKRRVLQATSVLENWQRGLYSGSIGYITPDGDFDFNVVIRTLLVQNGRYVWGVGGAITCDSDAEAEWEETQVKTRILRELVKGRG
jgi:para-aminobenzoate synthetase component 1